jgi:hypothetical protein
VAKNEGTVIISGRSLGAKARCIVRRPRHTEFQRSDRRERVFNNAHSPDVSREDY